MLLLNADWQPLRVVTIKRGVGLVVAGKAEIVEESDEPLRSEKTWWNLPSVIKLTHWVKIPFRSKIPLNRKALIARDKGKCAYCPNQGHTIDHVIPKSRGGEHTWTNVVLACSRCNQKKADNTLEEMGWTLSFKPYQPKTIVWFYVGLTELNETWEPYLQAAA